MGKIRTGDKVFDEQGLPCSVLQAHSVLTGRSCYRVRFSDGEEIVADAEHLWKTETRRTRKILARRIQHANSRLDRPQCRPQELHDDIYSTEEIAATLLDKGEANHSIPLARPLKLPYAELPIDPYVLGAWLGDGSSASSEITSADPEILEELQRCGESLGKWRAGSGCVTVAFGNAPYQRCSATGRMIANGSLHSRLKALGVLRDKYIPDIYLRASESQRWALLQGLMDTDGSIEPSGNAEYCSTRPRLADDVRELAISLGLKAVLYNRSRLSFTPYAHQPVFRLHRKRCRLKEAGKQSLRQFRRYIVAVEPVESVPVRCITVNSPSRLYLAGKGMIPTHNTRTGAETIKTWIEQGFRRIALLAATPADARDVMIGGESGLLNIYPDKDRPKYQPSLRRVVWPNGAVATIYSAHKHEDKSGLRGPQHEKAWGDEPAKWQYPGNLEQLMFGLRIGANPQAVLTGTPRPIKLIRDLVKESKQPHATTRVTYGSTYENRANLVSAWFSRIINKYEGTRLGRQELEAALLEDIDGALWTLEIIQRSYSPEHAQDDDGHINEDLRKSMERIVVAVDPSVNDGTVKDITSDDNAETGIMVCGRRKNKGHLLDDRSVFGHPTKWAQEAVDAYRAWGADYIVAEKNNGGELVRLTIQSVPGARNIPVKLVSASRGKYTRAEPVALLDERGYIERHGVFSQLEDQLTSWIPGAKSPDRLDAFVWGMTELMVDIMTFGASVVGEEEVVRLAESAVHGQAQQVIDRTILEEIKRGGLYFPN